MINRSGQMELKKYGNQPVLTVERRHRFTSSFSDFITRERIMFLFSAFEEKRSGKELEPARLYSPSCSLSQCTLTHCGQRFQSLRHLRNRSRRKKLLFYNHGQQYQGHQKGKKFCQDYSGFFVAVGTSMCQVVNISRCFGCNTADKTVHCSFTGNILCCLRKRLTVLDGIHNNASVKKNSHILFSLSSRASSSVIVAGMLPKRDSVMSSRSWNGFFIFSISESDENINKFGRNSQKIRANKPPGYTGERIVENRTGGI